MRRNVKDSLVEECLLYRTGFHVNINIYLKIVCRVECV